MAPPDSRGEAAIETIVHYRSIFTNLGDRCPADAGAVLLHFLGQQRGQHLLAAILDLWFSGVHGALLLDGCRHVPLGYLCHFPQ